jgi:hypothetical protein
MFFNVLEQGGGDDHFQVRARESNKYLVMYHWMDWVAQETGSRVITK